MEVINSSNDVVPNSVASSDVNNNNNNNNHSSSTNSNDNNTTNNIEHLKMLLENKQREAEDLAFSINLLETETAYRIQVAENEKEREVNAAQTNLNFKCGKVKRYAVVYISVSFDVLLRLFHHPTEQTWR